MGCGGENSDSLLAREAEMQRHRQRGRGVSEEWIIETVTREAVFILGKTKQ